jgi:hypothetical protein
VAFDHRAAAALNGRALLIAHCSFAISLNGITGQTSWPAAFSVSISASALMRAELIEHRLDVADLRPQGLFHLANRRFVVGGNVSWVESSHNNLVSFIRKY